jgi:hypothetical protein
MHWPVLYGLEDGLGFRSGAVVLILPLADGDDCNRLMFEDYFISRFLTLVMQELQVDAELYIRHAHEFANADAYK